MGAFLVKKKLVLTTAVMLGLTALLFLGAVGIAQANPIIVEPLIPLQTKPAAPSNLYVVNVAASTIVLSWKDNSNNESGFFVHRMVEGGAGYTTVGSVGANATGYKDTGLADGTKYIYVVTAYNGIGSSNFSNACFGITPAAAVTKPNAPTLNTAIASSNTQIDLNWTDNANNEVGFCIYRKAEGDSSYAKVGDTGSADWNGYGDNTCLPGTKYYYYVEAYNSAGTGASNILSATTTGAPPVTKPNAPSDLSASPISGNAVILTWKDNSDNEAGFKLERSLTQVGGYMEIDDIPANTTSYQNTELTSGTHYFYRIKAYNTAGDSSYSSLADVTTLTETTGQPKTEPPKINPPSVSTVLRFYINETQYYINDTPAAMDASPVITNSRTLLPVRYVATPLAADVKWDSTTKKVTISHKGTIIELWINKNTAHVNGVDKPIDPDNSTVTPVIMPPGRTMLPLRFIAENLGCLIEWDKIKKEVKVTYPKP